MKIYRGLTDRQIRSRFMMTVIVLAGALVALLAYWLIRPYDYLVLTPPLTISGPDTLAQGGQITFSRPSVCITADHEITVDRWAVRADGGGEFELPSVRFSSDEDVCSSPFLSTVVIPTYILPGSYYIRNVSSYQANPIRRVEITTTTPVFTVVPDADTGRGQLPT